MTNEWQPMKTAPKTRSLLLRLSDIMAVNGQWDRVALAWRFDYAFSENAEPTHWAELPTEPREPWEIAWDELPECVDRAKNFKAAGGAVMHRSTFRNIFLLGWASKPA